MNNREKAGGDSGGPWYTGSFAIGLHQGWTWAYGRRDVFSRAILLPAALGVEILP